MSELEHTVDQLLPRLVDDLKRLTAIPSIAFDGFDKSRVIEAHDLIVSLLADAGVQQIDRLDLPDTSPIIVATVPGPPGSPTVLMYSHYDVQPAGDEALWRTPPFEPTEIDGMIYGRGVADDKSNLISHIGALRALRIVGDGQPPVTLKIVFEGQEEWGSPFDAYPAEHPELFACDAMIIADMGNIEPGVPTFTTALRGTADVYVTLRTLAEPKHSGEYGGPAPDALIAMMRALATLHDDRETWPWPACGTRPGRAPIPSTRTSSAELRASSRGRRCSAPAPSPTACGPGRRARWSGWTSRPSRER